MITELSKNPENLKTVLSFAEKYIPGTKEKKIGIILNRASYDDGK